MQTLADENQKEQLMSNCMRFSYLLFNQWKGRANVEKLAFIMPLVVVGSYQ